MYQICKFNIPLKYIWECKKIFMNKTLFNFGQILILISCIPAICEEKRKGHLTYVLPSRQAHKSLKVICLDSFLTKLVLWLTSIDSIINCVKKLQNQHDIKADHLEGCGFGGCLISMLLINIFVSILSWISGEHL